MTKFHMITCCCSNGLGSSMIMSMNVKNVLREMGITNIPVRHLPLSDVAMYPDDLFVVGLDIAPQMRRFKHVIVLKDLISKEELKTKLEESFLWLSE